MSLKVVGGFALATAAAFPLDQAIRTAARYPSVQSGPGFRSFARGANSAALPGAYVTGYALYGAGVVTARRPLADAGFHTLASVIVSTNVAGAIKSAVGRTRPSATNSSREFEWGAPMNKSSVYAFPSGHTTAAFAGAATLAEELSRVAPRAARYVNPLLYAGATSVGLARVYGEAHWASDVVAGAAIGTLTARAIVRGAHSHPGNLVDRIAVHALVGASDRGRVFLGAMF